MSKHCLILLMIAIEPCLAHEFWLQPQRYTAVPGETVQVDWRIGMEFSGTPYVYLPDMATQVAQFSDGKLRPLTPRFAAKPALAVVMGAGTTIAVTESSDFTIEYEDKAAFETFLSKEHLQVNTDALAAEGQVIERYRRYAKALLTPPGELWQDRRVGLAFEWVIAQQDSKLKAQLFASNQPAADLPVRLFVQRADGTVENRPARTDANGVVWFDDFSEYNHYLLNAIRLYPIDPAANKDKASWHSDWASTTFQWLNVTD
ncbi:MAG: DUF4198 domain-containing protein [Reinekea sp.]|nr:DUF4198 domain-containing protein [Reinekea sp.]